MDWENERYIRLYTRDTVEWEMLPWKARALWPNLLRKVDRAGYLPLGKYGARGLAALVKLPFDECVEEGLQGLLEDGCVELLETEDGEVLFVPNFVAAQEARKSARQRKEEQRERERAAQACPVTPRHANDKTGPPRDQMSRNVTDSHEMGPKVTTSHTASQSVTPSLAEPSLNKTNTSNSAGAEPDQGAELFEFPERPPGRKFSPEALAALWNEKAHPSMPRVRALTGKRKRDAMTRLREHPEPEWWEEVIEAANASPHCRGESKPAPGASQPWRCNLDFLLANDTNAVRVLEGVYGDDRETGGRNQNRRPPTEDGYRFDTEGMEGTWTG